MEPYSTVLRSRVLDAVDHGVPRKQLAKTCSVSLPSMKRWLKLGRETGASKPRKGVALKWQDVHLENARITVRRTTTKSGGRILLDEPKTYKSPRTIQPTAGSVNALRAHRKYQAEERIAAGGLWSAHGLVFASETGTFIDSSNLRRRSFVSLLKKSGLPQIRFHNLRHTCATLLFGSSVHPKYVQELLGHANVAITLDTYSHVIPGMDGGTAGAMEDALG